MEKHPLIAALACATAAFSIPAAAVNLSPRGLGQALIYPYYTVNKSQDTYLTIANNGWHGVVAKVRFLEGRNGRPVLDFNLYLSAHDTWSGVVSQTGDDGGAMLKTSDRSCTTPTIPAAGLVFSASGYDGSGGLPADSGPQTIARTREGFIEVIAGGEILSGSPTEQAISHVQSGAPNAGAPDHCNQLQTRMIDDLVGPTNALAGSAGIINVGTGTYFVYNADALANFTEVPLFTATTGPLEPSLAQANTIEETGAGATAYLFSDNSSGNPDSGRAQSARFAHGIDAVTAVLMADSIQNDYLTAPGLGADTDWVVTLPTRRFYIDSIYPDYGVAEATPVVSDPKVALAVYDSEGGRALPENQERFALPFSTNVISFLTDAPAGAPSGVFGSRLNTNIAPTADSGSMRLDVTDHRSGSSASGFPRMQFGNFALYGTPVVGFMAYNIVNAQAQPGRLANYSGAFPHRTTACTGPTVLFEYICQR